MDGRRSVSARMEGRQAAQKPGEGAGAGTDGLSNGRTNPASLRRGGFTLSRESPQRRCSAFE